MGGAGPKGATSKKSTRHPERKTPEGQVAQVERPRSSPFTSKSIADAQIRLELLGDPLRLALLIALGNAEHGLDELGLALRQTQPKIRHQLARLRQAGLVQPAREGTPNRDSLTTRGQVVVQAVEALMATFPSSPIDPKLLEDVGGFVDDPVRWFQTPNAAFEGRKPVELLGTTDELRLRNRIEAAKLGMFS